MLWDVVLRLLSCQSDVFKRFLLLLFFFFFLPKSWMNNSLLAIDSLTPNPSSDGKTTKIRISFKKNESLALLGMECELKGVPGPSHPQSMHLKLYRA